MKRPKKLVIGIDYGTTNSGVAYAISTDGKADDADITVIREWSHGVREENLPSDVAYDDHGNPIGYAFDIPDGVQPVQWVKVLLEPAELGHDRPGTDRVWQTFHHLNKMGKVPVDVIADYLRWLWGEIERSLEESGTEVDAEEVVVVITVPASWGHKANASMRLAAQKAGIDSQGRTLKFRVEPEAAALLELKLRARRGQVAKGDCFIVCDAGGGTVDLVSFQVRSVEPLSLDQVVVSKGDFCGSAFINAAFETQLKVFLGKQWDRLSSEAVAQIRHKFEHTIKRQYNPERPKEYTIPVPGLDDDEKKGIKDGKLRLKEVILQVSFDEIMTQTRKLIDDQKDELRKSNLLQHLRAILLVGGFGASEYLQARLRQGYPEDERVKVWRGSRSWTAVVEGAVQCEIVNRDVYAPVNQRLSNYHYGIPYQRGDLKKVCWLIHKGQDVRDSSRIEKYILRLEDRPWLDEREYATISVQLVKTDKDTVTEDEDSSLQPHVDIDCRVPTAIRHSSEAKLISDNPRVWQIPAELVLAMDGPLLTARCKIKGKDVGLLDLKYRDDVDFPSHGLTALQTMEGQPSALQSTSGGIVSSGPQRGSMAEPERPSTSRSNSGTMNSPRLEGMKDSKRASKNSFNSVTAGDSGSPQRPSLPSRQSSGGSPTPAVRTSSISTLFRRRGSKTEAEAEADRLKREEKARKEEERRLEKEERQRSKDRRRAEERELAARNRANGSEELWVEVVNPHTGELMLQNRLTGKMEIAPTQQASGLGLRGF